MKQDCEKSTGGGDAQDRGRGHSSGNGEKAEILSGQGVVAELGGEVSQNPAVSTSTGTACMNRMKQCSR